MMRDIFIVQRRVIPDRLTRLITSPGSSIMETVERLNSAHKRIVVVLDDGGCLLGVVTDSNIRHALLNQIDFRRPVEEIMVRHPVTVPPDMSHDHVLTLMQRTTHYQIPVVDENRFLLDVLFLEDILPCAGSAASRVAVIMAGGLGQRLRPLTDKTPKPLITVGNRPILFTLLDQLISANFTRIYVTLNYKGEMIRDAIQGQTAYREHVEFITEKNRLGTAGSLRLLPEIPSGPFILVNGDVLTNVAFEEMLRFHSFERNAVTVAVKEEKFNVPYGIVNLDGTRITSLKEKPELHLFLNTGVYAIDPTIINIIPEGYCDMPSIVEDVIRDGRRVGCFPVHEYWLDIGEPSQLERARSDFPAIFFPNGEQSC